MDDVLEISSGEEDEDTVRQRKIISDLRKQLTKTQMDLERYKKDCTKLQKQMDAAKGGTLNCSELEDQISCQICTMKLWNPYILVCGHSFCHSCLDDWFSTTLTKYMATYPRYNSRHVNPPALPQVPIAGHHLHLPLHHLALIYPHLAQQIREQQLQQQQGPGPEYTCPTCRFEVKVKPIEDFALKSLVRKIAGGGGEASPGKVVRGDPWSGFFRA